MNFDKCAGNFGRGKNISSKEGRMPRDGSSAGLSSDAIQEVVTHKLLSLQRWMIRRKIKFWEALREEPLDRAPTTPELSERKMRWTFLYLAAMIAVSASSTATISSHPMSRPSFFQPEIVRQAIHLPSIQKPIPQLVDASMQMCKSRGAGGGRRIIPQNSAESWERHHIMSSATFRVMERVARACELPLKHQANSYKDGRWVCAAMRMREQ
jgi:hypothetical protein